MQNAERQISKNVDVCSVRVLELNVLNERDFFEDILPGLPLVQAPVDDCQRQGFAMPEKDERWHVEKLIDLSGDACQKSSVSSGCPLARLRRRGRS